MIWCCPIKYSFKLNWYPLNLIVHLFFKGIQEWKYKMNLEGSKYNPLILLTRIKQPNVSATRIVFPVAHSDFNAENCV